MKFDMYHDPDPDNERWFYGFKGPDVLVDITSLKPLESRQIKELFKECINTLEVDE